MKTKKTSFLARAAMTLLVMMLTATTAWADGVVTLKTDGDIPEGTAGHYYVNMEKTGNWTLHIYQSVINEGKTTFKVYDDGGKSGNYSNSCACYLNIDVPSGYVLQLSGNITTARFDFLIVYDGNTTNASKLLDKARSPNANLQTTIPTVTSSGTNMRLYFQSDATYNYAGLDLTVTVINTSADNNITVSNPATGGNVTSNKSTAKVSEEVTLTASPSDGYMLSDLSVKDANNNAVAVSDMLWYTGASTATFNMPGTAVTVTPTFANTWTAAGGLYVNMPKKGTKTATIPAGVTSFKVYDDGGGSGIYSYECDGTLVLTVPEGNKLQLSGSITTDDGYDKLTVYDNNAANGTKLLNEVSCTTSGTETPITTVTSTGNSMTLFFHTNEVNNFAGLDLTVEVITPLELADNADNSTTISNHDGVTCKVALDGRTIYTNGDWNTLCLPFALTAEQIATSPLAGFVIKELNGSTSGLNGSTLTLNFTDATAITAGKPYIVKWNTAVVDTSTPIFNPADDVVTALNFISGGATYDSGVSVISNEGPAKLVDGNTGTKYFMNADPWVEFHYASAITPKGYALWTANDAEDGSRNPTSWTIKAKNDGDADWTTLVTVDNSAGDKLPKAINTRTVFALDNSTAYKYFRFEAVKNSNGFQLAELQFCTEQPTVTPANITNPVFNNVTIDATAPTEVTSTDGKVMLKGTYSPFATTDGLLLDAHNTANGAFHAALSAIREGYTLEGWYTDAGQTTPATTIPFDADGSATLYVKWTEASVNVSYIDENGTEQTHGATEIDGTETNLPGGWYVVNSDVNLTTKLNFTGDTHLILADGKTLSIDASGDSDPNYVYYGLSCRGASTSYDLTIYGQKKARARLRQSMVIRVMPLLSPIMPRISPSTAVWLRRQVRAVVFVALASPSTVAR